MILSINNVYKNFGDKNVLNNISIPLKNKEKIALVGINGAGKTTLFKILTNTLSKDSGDVFLKKGATIGYLSQVFNPDFSYTIYDYVKLAFNHLVDLEKHIDDITKSLDNLCDLELEKAILNLSNLTADFEALNGYEYKSKITGILKGLGFLESDFTKNISSLSGGQQTRLSLAKTLLESPDVLLLDEPTNHLDLPSIEWLENYLKNSNTALIIISHDRYFLDAIVSKVYEIEHGIANCYNGNFTDYLMQKEINREIELHAYLSQQKDVEKRKKAIDKLLSFNREKSVKRARSKQKLLDKLDIIDKPIDLNSTMKLTFSSPILSGREVLKIRGLSMKFEDTLFENVDLDIVRGEKIALVGQNGAGKTTLFKLILNELQSNEGSIKLGSNVNISYYDQSQSLLNDDFTVFQTFDSLNSSITNYEVRSYLARFMFYDEDLTKKISSLSGGEKGRLSLAKIMYSKANFLLLDEPTNHLDVYSREVLENAIKNYEGTVLYISHDRYFINSTADKVIELKNKKFITYLGDYDYYMEKRDTSNVSFSETNISSTSKVSREAQKNIERKKRKKKNAIDKIEIRISDIEFEISNIDKQLNDPSNSRDQGKLLELFNQKEIFETELTTLFDKWEQLSE